MNPKGFSELTPEQKEKVVACETPQEVLALAAQEGYELSDAQLEEVSGGGWTKPDCPYCGSSDVDDWGGTAYCNNCGQTFVF